jgi:hypothetical protein
MCKEHFFKDNKTHIYAAEMTNNRINNVAIDKHFTIIMFQDITAIAILN